MLKLIKYILVIPVIIAIASIVGFIIEKVIDYIDNTFIMKWMYRNSEKLTYGTVAVGLILVLIISIFQ